MNYLLLISSVLIGSLIVLFLKPNKNYVRLLLAFSGAYLLSITILHLLPDVYNNNFNNTKIIGFLILSGILLQSVLESFSKGAEHGHLHLNLKSKKIPWILFLSLCIHAFSEGLPIHNHDKNLLLAIIIHKIPIAIVLTTFLISSKYSKRIIFIFLIVFSLMSPLGYFLSNKFLLSVENKTLISAFTIGIFLHISTIILFESTENHKFNFKKFISILLGIILTLCTL